MQASRLLARDNVSQALRTGLAAQRERLVVTADRTRLEVARLAFSDIRKLFQPAQPDASWHPPLVLDERYEIRDLLTLDDDTAAAVASVEVVRRNLFAGDGVVEYVTKIKLWDKPKSHDTLCKLLRLYTDLPTGEATAAFELPRHGRQMVSVH